MHWSSLLASSHSRIARQKIRSDVRDIQADSVVLFDLFDFNEIQSLSLMDLEFCVQCVLVSTGKIFGVAEDVSDMDVTNMMRTSFPEGGRITINQILR
jgi:hypothetical protein